MCPRSGEIDIATQPASVALVVTPEYGTRFQSSGNGIVSLPALGLPATTPALGTRSQSGGIGIVFQPTSAFAKEIRRQELSGTSQLAPVLEQTNLDQNTIVTVTPHKKKGSPASLPIPVPDTCSQSNGVGIVSRSASGLPTATPALGMHSQSGGIGIVSQPASASAKSI